MDDKPYPRYRDQDRRRAYLRAYQRRRRLSPEARAEDARINHAYKRAHRERATARERARKARVRSGHAEYVDRLVVLELHDGVCGICGGDVNPFDYHVDHVIPLALGGEHSYANSQPAHPGCNWSKGARRSAA